MRNYGITYKMGRHEAALRFILAFMEIPEKDRSKLVEGWNEDIERKGR